VIGYFDTSAVIPLLLAEPASVRCTKLWEECDTKVSSTFLVAEAYAALGQAHRMGRLGDGEYVRCSKALRSRLRKVAMASADRVICDRAGAIAAVYGLRGADAVHAASVEAVSGTDTVFISGDRKLLETASKLGVRVADIGDV
jgi:predicted nucleic acid-binding protein